VPTFSVVDDLTRPHHFYLDSSDQCYFLREYIPRAGYAGGETNNLINNFKKKPDKKGKPEWKYKKIAIDQIAKEMANAIKVTGLQTMTLVPIPPSKTRTHALYDDRMTKVLRGIGLIHGIHLDVRELIVQVKDTKPAHLIEDRPSPDEIRANYRIDEALSSPPPRFIGLFDDLLTTGAHFKAGKSLLIERFPEVTVIGLFVARRVPSETEWPPIT
jgi:hypothetical protein